MVWGEGIELGIRIFGVCTWPDCGKNTRIWRGLFSHWWMRNNISPCLSEVVWFLSFLMVYRCALRFSDGIYENLSWILREFFAIQEVFLSGWEGPLQSFNLVYLLYITGWRLKTWALWSEKARKPLSPGASFSPALKLVTWMHVCRGEGGTGSGQSRSRDHDAHGDANFSVIRSVWGTRKKKKTSKTSLVNYHHCRWFPALSSFLLILIPFQVATPGRVAYLFLYLEKWSSVGVHGGGENCEKGRDVKLKEGRWGPVPLSR